MSHVITATHLIDRGADLGLSANTIRGVCGIIMIISSILKEGHCLNHFLYYCMRLCECTQPLFPLLLHVFGMDHRAKNGSWDLILPTMKSPERLPNSHYSVYSVLWTTATSTPSSNTHTRANFAVGKRTYTSAERHRGKNAQTANKALF